MSRKVLVSVVSVLTIVAGSVAGGYLSVFLKPARQTQLTEMDVWRRTVSAPLPRYPADALAEGASGVVVLGVTLATDGTISGAHVLEAGDDRLGVAALEAVRKWRVVPDKDVSVGKVTLYFRIDNGKGIVAAPAREKTHALGGQTLTKPGGWGVPEGVQSVSVTEYERLVGQTGVVAIDVRDPKDFEADHRVGAVNIPLRDLSKRAGEAMSGASVVIIDCTRNASEACPLAAWTLRRAGAATIAIAGR